MKLHQAFCSCGQLRLTAQGDPLRVSMCNCLDCQRRTGSTYGVQARFAADQVEVSGNSTVWSRTGDEGTTAHFHFCPTCSSIVWYRPEAQPEMVVVPVGAFADPQFPAPTYSWYENRRHAWVSVPEGALRDGQ